MSTQLFSIVKCLKTKQFISPNLLAMWLKGKKILFGSLVTWCCEVIVISTDSVPPSHYNLCGELSGVWSYLSRALVACLRHVGSCSAYVLGSKSAWGFIYYYHTRWSVALWLGFGFRDPKPGQSHLQARPFGLAWLWLLGLGLAWLLAWGQAMHTTRSTMPRLHSMTQLLLKIGRKIWMQS